MTNDSTATKTRSAPAGLLLIGMLALLWGCNWPVLKVGVTELAPLTFRAASLPFAGIGLLILAKLGGDSIAIPRALWPKVAALAIFNIGAWNGLIVFGVQQMPDGRSAILVVTLPVWSGLISFTLLQAPVMRVRLL